jgi:hypothetical protein
MEESSQHPSSEIQDLQDQINQLTGHLKMLYERQELETHRTSRNKVKINPPSPFTGPREHSRSFLGQCDLVFNTQPEIYDNDTKKIQYTCSYLRDNAFTWYLTSELSRPGNKTTYAEFCDLFLTAFGDTDLESKAKRDIRNLKQRGSCSNYTTEFNRIIVNTSYNDAAKLDLYHYGLKDEVKDLLLSFEPTTDLKTYQRNAIKCDDRIYQRKLEKKNSSFRYDNPIERTRYQQQPESFPRHRTNNGPTPMDIDSLKLVNGRLSEEERRNRKQNGLCMYCGLKGHISRLCPKKPSGNARFSSGNGPSRTA